MIRSNAVLTLKALAVDSVVALLYFPVWWYTLGAARVAAWGAGTVRNAGRSFGVRIWLKNLFKPMFGQHDFPSRIISFFMRLVMIFYYSLVLLLLTVLMIALFLLWLAAPAFFAWQFAVQIVGILKTAQA